MNGLLEDVVSINPPAELKAYHNAQVTSIQAYTTVANDKDQDDLFNVFEFLGAGLIVAAGIAEQAKNDLPDKVRAALEEAGCLDDAAQTEQSTSEQIDRSDPAAIGDRIAVHRRQAEDRFEMIMHERPNFADGRWRVPVTVYALQDEWSYETSHWASDSIELVSEPDRNGRIYKIREADNFWNDPDDSLSGVILIAGGRHRGALYFAGDAPASVRWVDLRYPTEDGTHIIDLTR